ncbi:MAG TPA: putative motility protein [Tepidisphaeraceae bacterium]|nr:putative motility protein [Tepidisphaeraceae bacterium]
MDLTAGIAGMKQAQILGQAQMRVARKMLDMQEMQGAAAVRLIEAAGKAGRNVATGDMLVAAATGLGASLDTYA